MGKLLLILGNSPVDFVLSLDQLGHLLLDNILLLQKIVFFLQVHTLLNCFVLYHLNGTWRVTSERNVLSKD